MKRKPPRKSERERARREAARNRVRAATGDDTLGDQDAPDEMDPQLARALGLDE